MPRFSLPLVALAVALSAAAPDAAAQAPRRPQVAARTGTHQTAGTNRTSRVDGRLAAIDAAVDLSRTQSRQVRAILLQGLSPAQTDARILRVLNTRQDMAYRRLQSGRATGTPSQGPRRDDNDHGDDRRHDDRRHDDRRHGDDRRDDDRTGKSD